MFCRHVFGNISGGFRGISRFLGNFAGFRGNTRISRVRDHEKYQKPCYEICGFFEVSRSSIIAFLNLADVTCSVLIILISDRYSYRYTEMEVHACIGRYKRSNYSNIKGNNIWTSTSPCEQITLCGSDFLCTSREGRWPGDTQMPFSK